MSHRALWIFSTLLWLAALTAAALWLDRPVAEWVKAHPPYNKHLFVITLIKLPGNFLFTLSLTLLLLLLHPRGTRAAGLLLLSAVLGGLVYSVLKWLVGRHRPVNGIAPFHLTPLAGGLRGLFLSPPNLSFPSGHATLSFATAAALCVALPRWRWAFVLGALVVSAERVLENAHYVSDTIAGAGVGVLAALLADALLRRSTPPESRSGFPVLDLQPQRRDSTSSGQAPSTRSGQAAKEGAKEETAEATAYRAL